MADVTGWLLAVLGLLFVQIMLAPSLQYLAQGNARTNIGLALGPRDNPPPEPRMAARARRALANLFESLWFFVPLSLLAIILDRETAAAILGAQIFFFGRAAYVPAYLSGISGLRSLIWVIASAGLVIMLTQVIG